jgi:ABC-type oligopeptide transport system substrate-binding subunit
VDRVKWFLALLVLCPQDEGTLRVAWGSVQTVDPALAILPQDVRVAAALFDGLDGATSKADGAVITFTLPERKWSDGRPVKASDYRFAWRRCLDPSTGSPWAFRFRHIRNALSWHEAESLQIRLLLFDSEGPAGRAEVLQLAKRVGSARHALALRGLAEAEKDEAQKKDLAAAAESAAGRKDLAVTDIGIEAVDDRTLRVTLEAPRSGFHTLAGTTPFLPVPEHVVSARRDRWTHPDHVVTDGAYSIERWSRDGLVLKRVRGSGPEFVSLAAPNTIGEAWPLYERGTVDWIERHLVPPEKMEELAKSGDLRTVAGSSILYLRTSPALKAGLRKAIALVVDRAPLAKKAGAGAEGTRSLAGGAEAPERDLAAAMTFIVADYPDLKMPKLRLLVWKGTTGEEVARVLRPQLEEALALSVRIDLREGPAYHAGVASGEFELALGSFAPEPGDPSGVLDLFPDGRTEGEKALIDAALAIPLLKEGEWIVAKPRVEAGPGTALADVRLKK